jgi:hypothetical protein
VFYYENELRLHRLVFAARDAAYLLGDNARTVEIVPRQAVLAEYTKSENGLRQTIIVLLNALFYFVDRMNIRPLAVALYLLRRHFVFSQRNIP